jgi:DNA modification methylase
MTVQIIEGDCRDVLATLPAHSVHCVVTSPPYFGLRDYGVDGQIGLEPTPDAFVAELVAVFREVRRALRDDGTVWLNLGDSYAGSWGAQGRQGSTGEMSGRAVSKHRGRSNMSAAQIAARPNRCSHTGSIRQEVLKPKDLIGIPWRVAFALQADGWYLRQDIEGRAGSDRVPGKTNGAMKAVSRSGNKERKPSSERGCPEGSGSNVCGSVPWEGDTRNARSVWTIATQPFKEAHFATFPPNLAERCIKAGCPKGGTVLDPFGGAGTTGLVADRLQRNAVLIELNPAYAEMARRRIEGDAPLLMEASQDRAGKGAEA